MTMRARGGARRRGRLRQRRRGRAALGYVVIRRRRRWRRVRDESGTGQGNGPHRFGRVRRVGRQSGRTVSVHRRQREHCPPEIGDAADRHRPVEVEKLSIYNQSVLPKNPLNWRAGQEHDRQAPPAGPNHGAGRRQLRRRCRIDNLPPGQERLISYGIDQEVHSPREEEHAEQTLLTGKIVKGVLDLTCKQVFSQDYTAENKSETPRRC